MNISCLPLLSINACAESYSHCGFLNRKTPRKGLERMHIFSFGALYFGGLVSAFGLKKNQMSGSRKEMVLRGSQKTTYFETSILEWFEV